MQLKRRTTSLFMQCESVDEREAIRGIQLSLTHQLNAGALGNFPFRRSYGTSTGSWFTICGSYENTSRLEGSTLTLSQLTSPRLGWLSPKVSTRVKLTTRFPALSSSGLSTRK